MSGKYKIGNDETPHFVTFTVTGWLDVFSRDIYKDLFVESLQYCQQNKGLILHAWIIMTNHVHLIISSNSNQLSNIVRDLKKFTSKQIINAINENDLESRKSWMINTFSFAAKYSSSNKDFKFWKQDYHPIELDTLDKLQQRINYLHENPVRSGLVWEPWHYKYSSAIDYYSNEHGLLSIDHL